MKQNKLIYLVEDELAICHLVTDELKNYKLDVNYFHDGLSAIAAFNNKKPDICIIDLGLPDMDGIEVVRHVRNDPNVGIIILSGRGSLPDKVLGLELGADDYLSKPFDPRELVARINSILRRLDKPKKISTDNATMAYFDNWVFDLNTLTVIDNNEHVTKLSVAEANLLIFMLKSPKQILNRDQLMADIQDSFDRSIDVRMSRIRKKIEADPKNPTLIKTIYGAGYIFTSSVEWK